MSDAAAIAQSLVSMQSASRQQALSLEMVRQNAEADQGLVTMLEQGVEQAKATLPDGQGLQVDRFA